MPESCSYTWEGNNRIIYYRLYHILIILQWLYEAVTEKLDFIPPLHLKFFK